MRLGRIAFLHRDDVVAGLGIEFDHVLHAALFRLHDHVGQKQRERLVADQLARAPDGMAKPHRHLLAGEAGLAGRRLQPLQAGELVVLAALRKRVVELELDVEMILDDRLVAAGDEDEVLDPRVARLVDDILDDRPVDDRQHFLRDGLGGREEPCAEAGDREDCFANSLHAVNYPFEGLLRNPVLRHFRAGIETWTRAGLNIAVRKASRRLFVPDPTYGKLNANRVRR